MPCQDTRAIAEFQVTSEQGLIHFDYHKDTCQKSIGANNAFVSFLYGRHVDDIQTLSWDEVRGTFEEIADTHEDQFLLYMQWQGLQLSLQVYLGEAYDQQTCRIMSINWDEHAVVSVRTELLPPSEMPKIASCVSLRKVS